MTGSSPRVSGGRVRAGTRGALSLVEVSTGDGVTGIGATGSPVQAIDAIVRGCGLAELVIGEDPLEPTRPSSGATSCTHIRIARYACIPFYGSGK